MSCRRWTNTTCFCPPADAKFGTTDYAIDSNSMFELVERMGEIPLRTQHGNAAYLRDVATPMDTSLIQTNVVRINGRREVYIPVYRQLGASTLKVVDDLKAAVPTMTARLTRPGIDLKVVMDQSIYVRHSIRSLIEEGVLGAVLCSLVILVFLGEIAHDADRDHDDPHFRPGGRHVLVLHGQHDQRDDAGRAFAGHWTAGGQRDHLPGKHAPPPGLGRQAMGSRISGRQRSGHAGTGGQPVHIAGARAAGADAGSGRILVSADGHGRGVFDDRGLLVVTVVRAHALRGLVARRTACEKKSITGRISSTAAHTRQAASWELSAGPSPVGKP